MPDRYIRVKGKGTVSVPPDCIQINLSLEVIRLDYEMAIQASAELLEEIRDALRPEGLTREDIKTTSFGVSPHHERRENRAGRVEHVFAGYSVTNRLEVKLDQDSKRLGRVLAALARTAADPRMSVRYTLKDDTAMKAELLRRAVADAKAKAAILAESAGVTLGPMLTVDYSWGEIEFRHSTDVHYLQATAPAYGAMVDLEPDDLEASDTVTVVWEIG